jgi:glutamate dehydrogenase/leucine dehydrogenase
LDDVLGRAFDEVWNLHTERGIDPRLAAHTIAVARVAEAHKLRGLYP